MADKKINGSLEITGKLNPNARGYGFNLPPSASLTADKTIATEKYVDGALSSKADLVNGLVPAAQLPSYVDDVLESSDAGHFPSAGEKGKIYVALDTGFTYRWSGSEYVQIGGQDLSNFVTLDTDQTIAGVKTFSNEAKLSSTYNGGTTYSFEADDTYGQLRISHDNRRLLTINDNGIMPNGPISLGNPSYNWQDLYLSGNLSDGTNSVSVADIASSTFNVINASDIVNNTLTQEQYDLITNGKPTLIKGVYNNHEDTIIMPTEARSGTYTLGMFLGRADSSGQIVGGYYLHNVNRSLYYYAQSDRVNRLGGIKSLNGKDLPVYPSSTGTFNFKYANGALTWTEEWYGTQAEYDALGTYDDNTIYNITEE